MPVESIIQQNVSMPIKWILLDGSGVLFTMHHQHRLRALSARSAEYATTKYINQVIWKSGIDLLFDYGYFTQDEILDELRHRIGYAGTLSDLRHDWCSGFTLRNDLLDFLLRYFPTAQLAILSDNGPLLLHSIPKIFPRLGECVDHIFFSCEMKLCKPSAIIFQRVVEQLHVSSPQEILFMDDLASNCLAAQLLGLQTYHFTSLHAFQQEIFQSNSYTSPGNTQ